MFDCEVFLLKRQKIFKKSPEILVSNVKLS